MIISYILLISSVNKEFLVFFVFLSATSYKLSYKREILASQWSFNDRSIDLVDLNLKLFSTSGFCEVPEMKYLLFDIGDGDFQISV